MGTRKPSGPQGRRHAARTGSGISGGPPARPIGPGRNLWNLRNLRINSWRRWLLPALLGLYVVFSVLLFDPKPATFGDNAIYLILGKSLAAGTGYRDLYLPGAPEHTQYPPGFPLMLAAITLISGGVRCPAGVAATNVLAAKLFVVLTGLGAMFFIYRLCGLIFRDKAWPLMILFASLPALVENNHWVLSEMPFLLVAMAALYCLVLADLRPKAVADRLRIGAGALAVAACYIRTAGLVIVLGMALYLLARRQYRNLIILLLLFAAAIVPWQLHNMRTGQTQPYVRQLLARHPYFLDQGRAGFGDWALRVWQNLRDYATKVIPRMLFPVGRDSWIEAVSGIVLSLLATVGFGRGLKKLVLAAPAGQLASAATVGQFGALASCALFAVPVLLGWPYIWLTERFLLPFLPLVVIFLFSGMSWLGVKLGWRWFAPAFVGVLVLANIVHMTSLARTAVRDNLGYLRGDRYSGYPLDWRRYFESIEWVKAHTPEDAVVMARKPEFVYLLAGRRSFCYPFSRDRAEVRSAMMHSQYILADNFQWTETTSFFLGPVLQDNPDLWELVLTTAPPEFYVLKVIADAPAVR